MYFKSCRLSLISIDTVRKNVYNTKVNLKTIFIFERRLRFMKRDVYNTKHREEVLSVLKNAEKHLTAEEICSRLRENGKAIGVTTVYRQLSKLENEGLLRKYTVYRLRFVFSFGLRASEGFFSPYRKRSRVCR